MILSFCLPSHGLLSRALAILLAVAAGTTARADGFANGQAADVVLGQQLFTTGNAGLGDGRFESPDGVAIDPTTGKLFVADTNHNRILRFPNATALQTGASAEAVFGQADFNGTSANQGGAATAKGVNAPFGVFVDGRGVLWVADGFNHRVLAWIGASFSQTNTAADFVLGQSDFTGTSSGLSGSRMNLPVQLCVDAADRLWVADTNNNRVLRFDDVYDKSNGAAADGVLGQIDFNSKLAFGTATGMNAPRGVIIDALERLWVSDSLNHRILRFDNAADLTNGAAATGVLGQPDLVRLVSGTAANRLNSPGALHLDLQKTLWVADAGNARVLGYRNASAKSDGASAEMVLGQSSFTTNNTGTTATTFEEPGAISSNALNQLFISDPTNHRVLRFTPIPAPVIRSVEAPRITGAAKAKITGRASGTVSKVNYRVGKSGPFQTAKGTIQWSFNATLKPGKNVVTIVAVGPGGSSVAKTLTIIRK